MRAPSATVTSATFEVRRLGTVDYHQALLEQRARHSGVVAQTAAPTLLLLEHPPVFTAGRRTEPHERPVDGTPVVDVDRGGKITWHGPGQIVGYPIMTLPMGMGVVDYVRALEGVLIDVCAAFGLSAERVSGRSGVWLEGVRKVAAIGVRVEHNTTLHGFALNVDPDLTWFDRIVPCGIADAQVTSLARELKSAISVDQVLPILEDRFLRSFA